MAHSSFGDAARDRLRTLVGEVDQQMSLLPSDGEGEGTQPSVPTPGTHELRRAWQALVHELALGPPPETRRCPACAGTGMRAASRCLHCWAKLAPLAAAAQLPNAFAAAARSAA